MDKETTRALLADVQRAAQGVTAAQRELLRTVRVAREAQVSYAAIGKALGVTRQAAWERFARRINER